MKFEFPINTFRMLPNPYGEYTERNSNPVVYECYVEVQDIPDNFPMETNPREQNLKTNVAKNIEESLKSYEENFHIKNRGIILSAASFAFNSKTSHATIFMTDTEVHGNVDGGHTYKIILANRNELQDKQYVRLEVIIGAEDFFQDLAKARNTSVQVKDTSIAELEKKFEFIKDAIGPLANEIAFKENDIDKRISIDNIISILSTFNLNTYSDADKQPISAYSQKSFCVKQFLAYDENDIHNPFHKMVPIIPSILKLHDYIEKKLPEKYKEVEPGGKYGLIKGIQSKKENSKVKFQTDIYGDDIEYKSPRSFVLPILASFRALIRENEEGYYEWIDSPFKLFDKVGGQMAKNTKERSKSLGYNVNALGKDAGHWRDLFQIVLIEKLMKNA
ncbi:MAG: AIPR family protein [Pelistega sp.]|nr:AIPR family protein [Pelistega sp.]